MIKKELFHMLFAIGSKESECVFWLKIQGTPIFPHDIISFSFVDEELELTACLVLLIGLV